MKSKIDQSLRLILKTTPEQTAKLAALQQAFAEVCNAIAPIVRQTAVWNRVALHHMAYRPMRERFPAVGAQLICNAIYAVSRTARHVFQSPESPYHVARPLPGELPELRFSNACPVFLDRNTFSLKDGRASLFTLDGRMRFDLNIGAEREAMFISRRLLEIVLIRVHGEYTLTFNLQDSNRPPDEDDIEVPLYDDLPPYLDVAGRPMSLPVNLPHGRVAGARAKSRTPT